MKVRTRFRPWPLALNAGFMLFCIVGGAWGAYDYWVAYPAIERANAEFVEAERTKKEIEGRGPGIGEDDRRRLRDAMATMDRIVVEHGGQPRQLAAYDRPLQLWLWVIGCGLLGTPFFARPVVRMLRHHWQLDDDGTLLTPKGPIRADEVVDIDMSRWCSPTGSKRSTWKAWLVTKDGRRVELDDHDNRDMDLIIGHYAHRFHPDEWTEKAKRVGTTEPAPQTEAASSA